MEQLVTRIPQLLTDEPAAQFVVVVPGFHVPDARPPRLISKQSVCASNHVRLALLHIDLCQGKRAPKPRVGHLTISVECIVERGHHGTASTVLASGRAAVQLPSSDITVALLRFQAQAATCFRAHCPKHKGDGEAWIDANSRRHDGHIFIKRIKCNSIASPGGPMPREPAHICSHVQKCWNSQITTSTHRILHIPENNSERIHVQLFICFAVLEVMAF